ncbi:MAG TPA: Mu transposase C-terminal domain-containing protein [Cyclobacteriaceae bacterium]|nr:Mu transposase C-terminal domain-containing protein [Cyclobacteriaceae bacterium]HRJ83949.1 Mu transposase C-terminal domain-containing protein [Cyclobacteriaceae bacterium]
MSSNNQTAICINVISGKPIEIPLSELNMVEDSDEHKESIPIESFTEEQIKQAEFRFNIIKDILDTPVDPVKIKALSDANEVGISTIYKWRSRYLRTGFIQSLIDKEGRGGKGTPRLPKEINEIIDECIKIYYLKGKKSITKTYNEIKILCQKEQLKIPNLNTIKNRIRRIPDSELAKFRRGRKKSKEIHEAKTGKIPGAEYPFSLVQIDHTLLDIVIVDEIFRMVLGRPWLTLLIDVCTRMPLGRYISLDPPGNYGTGQAIACSLYPKDKLLAEYGIKHPWPVWGPIKILHCDNAGEFHSKMLENSCMSYGIELQFRKKATPHYGAHIERLLGTFNKEIHDLPGTTFSNTQERRFYDYDSEKLAAFTLKEFDQWLITFITQVYIQRYHEGIGTTPLDKFNEFIVGSDFVTPIGVQPMYPDYDKIKLDFLPYVQRTIQTYGVEIDNFTYYDSVLSPFINAKVDTEFTKSRAKQKFIFKVDPNNLNRVYFLHPESGEYFQINNSDLSTPPITKWEKRAIAKQLKTEGKKVNQAEIIAGYNKMNEITEMAISKTKKARRRNHRRTITANNVVNLQPFQESFQSEQPSKINDSNIQTFEVDHDSFI